MPLDSATQRSVGIVAGKLPNWYLEQQRSQNHVSLRPLGIRRHSQGRKSSATGSGSQEGVSWRQRAAKQSALTDMGGSEAISHGGRGDAAGLRGCNEEHPFTKVTCASVVGHAVGGEQSAGRSSDGALITHLPNTSAVTRYVPREAHGGVVISSQLPISPPVSSPWYNANLTGASGAQISAAVIRAPSSANNPMFQTLRPASATLNPTQSPLPALYQLNRLGEDDDENGNAFYRQLKDPRPKLVQHVSLDV